MGTNSIEIMLELLEYIQGQMFNDAKAIDIGNYSHKDCAYVDLQCRNKDKIKISVEYEPHIEVQGDAE